MENVFSFRRFLNLTGKELSESRSTILYISAIAVSISIVAWLFGLVLNSNISISPLGRLTTISVILLIANFILPFSLYSKANHKIAGIGYATLPVSSLEKFLSMVLISVFAVPLSILLSCIITDYVLALITPEIYKGYLLGESFRTMFSNMKIAQGIGSFFLITGTALFGNILFRKNKIFKTIFSVILINIFLGICSVIFIKYGLDINNFEGSCTISAGVSFSNTPVLSDKLRLLQKVAEGTRFFILYILPVILYGATYYKLKKVKY